MLRTVSLLKLLIPVQGFLVCILPVVAQNSNFIQEAPSPRQSATQGILMQDASGKPAKGARCSPGPAVCSVGLGSNMLNRLPGVSRRNRVATKGHTFGAFWKVGEGYTSTLVVRNKDSANSLAATVVLFSRDGEVEGQTQLEIAPHLVERLLLNQFVKAGSESVRSGGLMLDFPDAPASKSVGDVIIENYAEA